LYLGTPIQHKFGESTDKFIGLFIFENQKYNHDNLVFDKIKLNCPIKKIIHLEVDQVNSFCLLDNIEAKIIIRCEPHDIKTLAKQPNVLKWIKQGAQVIYKNKPTTNKPKQDGLVLDHQMQFNELLHHQIKTNDNLMSIYHEIFN
jgi:hypothetical protein